MAVFLIVLGVALGGVLFLAWRTDHKNKALRAQSARRMQGRIGDGGGTRITPGRKLTAGCAD